MRAADKKKAIALRKKGLSYREIMERIDVGKGTLSNWLRGVALTDDQQEVLDERVRENQRQLNSNITDEQRRKGGQKCQELYGEAVQNLNQEAREKGMLVYLEHELEVKVVLEEIYGQTFQKERLGRYVFDFASEDILMEHTAYAGTVRVVERFREARDLGDTRRRIAYIATSRGKRYEQLLALDVEVHHYTELNEELQDE